MPTTDTGSAGLRLNGSLQTSLIQSEPGAPLRIESLTKQLRLQAGDAIALQSRAALTVNSLLDLRLHSQQGDLVLEAGSILLRSLPLGRLATPSPTDGGDSTPSAARAFDLCVCAGGRLFLSADGCQSGLDDLC